jgi:hypothetical protein
MSFQQKAVEHNNKEEQEEEDRVSIKKENTSLSVLPLSSRFASVIQ